MVPLCWGYGWSHVHALPCAAQFTKAVEQKQVAEQDAERSKFVVLKAEQVRTCEAACVRPSRALGQEASTGGSRINSCLASKDVRATALCCHVHSEPPERV